MIDRIQLPLGRLGRRGAVLIILGTLWILVGANVLAADYDPSLALSASPAFQSALWIGTGFVACAFAWRPQGHAAPGVLALYIMVGYRCISYAFDLLFWIIIAALILIIAGWREAGDDHPAGLGVPS